MTKSDPTAVLEAQLDNGLGVLLKEDHSAPIASVWTWYRVGSRNERPGKTGISHWVEHMQFKGTSRIGKGQIFRDVSRVGGTLNALTSHDWTAYFETLPVAHIDLALEIESDRMVNSLFLPEEVESERTVILSERQGSENHPGYRLYEEVNGLAFQSHPYRHMVIGHATDLRRITRDDLYAHYTRHYHPANAFIVAVGDFDKSELLVRIDSAFGHLAAGPAVPRELGIVEPEQPGERRAQIEEASGAPYLRVAFHAPDARNADLIPLLVSEALLSGAQPMGFSGGGGMGRSSRLYRALVASGLARSASSDMGVTVDPYLFQIAVTGLPGGDLAVIERTVDEEFDRLREEPVSLTELARATRQLEAQVVYSSEGASNQAFWLGQWHIVDSWSRALSFAEEIRAVTPEDVQRVARQYFSPERRTVGWLVPRDVANGANERSVDVAGFAAPLAWGLDGPIARSASPSSNFERAELRNGAAILAQHRPESRFIVLRARLAAGSIWEAAEQSGIASLTARATLRGAGGHSFKEISERTDSLGSSITIDAGQQFVEARVRCLREDFPEMVQLLGDALLLPHFPAEEVEKLQAEQLGSIAEAENDTRATADRLLRRSVYPFPNPLGRPTVGEQETVKSLDSSMVRAYHSRRFVATGAAIAVVGGFESFAHVVDVMNNAFVGWTTSPDVEPPLLSSTLTGTSRENATILGKSQADLAVGLPTIPRTDQAYYALDAANLILGRLGLMGRLGAEVRDRQGLAYYAFSQIEPRKDGSLWVSRAGVDPKNVERALSAITIELDRLRTRGVTEEEYRDAQTFLVGSLQLALESHDGVAAALLNIEEFDLGLDYLQRYPGIIAALSRDEIQEAADRHLDPSRLAVAVAQPA